MFVSSYSTYIQANTSDKAARQGVKRVDGESKSFKSSLEESISTANFESSNLPIDYISKNKVLNNKQLLENQNSLENTTKSLTDKFGLQNSLVGAKGAYESNSKMFSLFQKPHATLDQTPKIENTLPKEPKDIKELNMRYKMVNTYVANDNYYKITA